MASFDMANTFVVPVSIIRFDWFGSLFVEALLLTFPSCTKVTEMVNCCVWKHSDPLRYVCSVSLTSREGVALTRTTPTLLPRNVPANAFPFLPGFLLFYFFYCFFHHSKREVEKLCHCVQPQPRFNHSETFIAELLGRM